MKKNNKDQTTCEGERVGHLEEAILSVSSFYVIYGISVETAPL